MSFVTIMLKEELSKIGHHTLCTSAIIVRDRKVLLGLRNYTPDKWKSISVWTTPGGRSEENETVEVGLRREVQEETGITNLDILEFIAQTPGAKEGDILSIFFCTTDQEPKLMEPEKFSEWRWVPIEEYLQGEPWNIMNPTSHEVVSNFFKKKFPTTR